MQHDVRKFAHEVLVAIGKIRRFVAGQTKESFVTDELITSAVHMQFIVIGEAVTAIRKEFPEHFANIRDAQKIVGFRNIIAHAYDLIVDDVVWNVIENYLDNLEADINQIVA